MMVGGLMIPSAMLPETLGKVATLLPSTYAMQAFQGLAYKQNTAFDPLWSLIILLVSGMLSFMLAIYLFNWDRHNATRRRHPLLALLASLPYVVGLFLS
jgi:ABC-2 type transport system permease protein